MRIRGFVHVLQALEPRLSDVVLAGGWAWYVYRKYLTGERNLPGEFTLDVDLVVPRRPSSRPRVSASPRRRVLAPPRPLVPPHVASARSGDLLRTGPRLGQRTSTAGLVPPSLTLPQREPPPFWETYRAPTIADIGPPKRVPEFG
jgi:hypothetical protein